MQKFLPPTACEVIDLSKCLPQRPAAEVFGLVSEVAIQSRDQRRQARMVLMSIDQFRFRQPLERRFSTQRGELQIEHEQIETLRLLFG